MTFSTEEKQDRTSHNVYPLARLKSGVSLKQAQAEMNAIQQRMPSLYPAAETGWSVTVQDLGEFVAGYGRSYMLLMLGAVGFVLLIACANVTNLLLVRSTSRQNELAIRRALGGSRARVIRQLLIESLLLGHGRQRCRLATRRVGNLPAPRQHASGSVSLHSFLEQGGSRPRSISLHSSSCLRGRNHRRVGSSVPGIGQ